MSADVSGHCHEKHNVADDGLLLCDLPFGHEGPHWDAEDNVTWERGKP